MQPITRNVGVDSKKAKSMLTKSERKFISKAINNAKVTKISKHATKRGSERSIPITKEEFLNELNWGNLLEVQHYNDGSVRFLFRGSHIHKNTPKGNANIVFVYIPKTGEIRSCWFNNVNDKHATLDMSVYDENANIFEWVK